MPNPTFIKSFRSQADVAAHLICKNGTADYAAIPAAASTDSLIGVSTEIDVTSGDPVDIITDGIAWVKLGGTVVRGDYITSDSTGKGVKANPGTGVSAEYIGKTLQSGASGDLVEVDVQFGRVVG